MWPHLCVQQMLVGLPGLALLSSMWSHSPLGEPSRFHKAVPGFKAGAREDFSSLLVFQVFQGLTGQNKSHSQTQSSSGQIEGDVNKSSPVQLQSTTAILSCYSGTVSGILKDIHSMGAPLVAQWLRICLPMQGTRVQALVWEDLTCRGATRPVSHKC